jgi:hypothetical protein
MQKLNNDDYTAFDVYRRLSEGPIRFERSGNYYAECMNITLEEDLRLRAALESPRFAFQSKVRFYLKSEEILAGFLADSLAHGHDVAYVNPWTNKAFSAVGGFPQI